MYRRTVNYYIEFQVGFQVVLELNYISQVSSLGLVCAYFEEDLQVGC